MEVRKRLPRSVHLPPEMEAEVKRRASEPGNQMPVAQWIRNAIEKALQDGTERKVAA